MGKAIAKGILQGAIMLGIAGAGGNFVGAVAYNPPIDLGSFGLGEDQAWAYSINNHGEVVGEAYAPDGLRPFLWTPEGGMREIRDTIQDPLYQLTAIEHAQSEVLP